MRIGKFSHEIHVCDIKFCAVSSDIIHDLIFLLSRKSRHVSDIKSFFFPIYHYYRKIHALLRVTALVSAH